MKQLLWTPVEFQTDFVEELHRKNVPVLKQQGNVFLVESDRTDFVWAEARGLNAEVLQFDSISQGQKLLRERGRLWCASAQSHFRRSELLGQDLLQPKKKKKKFQEALPSGLLGCYVLVSENEMWVTPSLSPAVPPGSWEFEETLEAPSRAYLKLWELFTREGFGPKVGQKCLELGSSPGGWTWVLLQKGCSVISVDKGEMDPKILTDSRVRWIRKDAFDLKPEDIGTVDWFFSDMICYPSKLLPFVQEWIEQKRARNFVCTLKFQGKTDFEALEGFLKIPGSRAVHLQHNKHEVTWFMTES